MIIKRYDREMAQIINGLIDIHLTGDYNLHYIQRVITMIEMNSGCQPEHQTMIEKDILAYLKETISRESAMSKLYDARRVFEDLNDAHIKEGE